jgi:hypothetical protein
MGSNFMTRQLATHVRSLSWEAAALPNSPAIAPAASALLAELEQSLEASQRALLSRDLEGLERETREQTGLHRSLEILSSRNGALDEPAPRIDPAVAAGLRAAQWRVLYLGRVQAALLTRAQRSLRIVSHRLAGSEASYAQPDFPPASSLARTDSSGLVKKLVKKEENRIKLETESDQTKEAGPCPV